jgi:type II secretory pathway pseudopilin PulG
MNIFIAENEQQKGPFTEDQLRKMLAEGKLSPTDLAWHEGLSGWLPLNQILDISTTQPGITPPPVPSRRFNPTGPGKNEPLATWSLVLGCLSLVGCTLFAAIPALVCGHVAMSRIKRNPSAGGRGKALGGLITGYLSILIALIVVPLLVILATPGVEYGLEKAKAAQMAQNARQIQLAISTAAMDGTISGIQTIGYPADAGMKSKDDVKKMLLDGFISESDLMRMDFDNMAIGNISFDDPENTIFIRYKPDENSPTIIVLKDGQIGVVPSSAVQPAQVDHWAKEEKDYRILTDEQSFGIPPPRTPAFLD